MNDILVHEKVDHFEKPNTPQVDKLTYSILTRSEILSESAGEVTKTVRLEVDGPLKDTEGSCFCPNIFGMDRDAISEARLDSNKSINYKAEKFKQSSNTGHIKLPVPIVQPGTYEKYYLQRILTGASVKPLTEVIQWNSYISRPIYKQDRILRVYLMDKFLKDHSSDIEHLENAKKLRIIPLSNSWKYDPGLQFKDGNGHIEVTLNNAPRDTQILVKSEGTSNERQTLKFRLEYGVKYDITLVNEETKLDYARSFFFKEGQLKTPITESFKGSEHAIGEKIIVINNELFDRTTSKTPNVVHLNDMLYWKENTQLLSGSYAILDLLTDIEVDRELVYLKNRITLSQKILNEISRNEGVKVKQEEDGTYSKDVVVGHKVLSKIQRLRDEIKKLGTQFRMIMAMAIDGIEPYELVTDIVPVIPLEHRNRTPITTDKGQVSYRNDKINQFYNQLIENKDRINSSYSNLPSYEDLIRYKTMDKERPGSGQNIYNSMRWCQNLLTTNLMLQMKNVQAMMHGYLISADDMKNEPDYKALSQRIGSKQGKARSDAQAKRIDRTARAVITPDKNLEIDEIGMPYDILKVHFATELRNKVHVKLPSHLKVSKSTISHMIEKLGDRYTNTVLLKDDNANILNLSSNVNITFKSVDTNTRGREDVSAIEGVIIDTLREIIKDHRYLAIRFPSLHHLNGLGYKIQITFDETIKINPLLCGGYNADFDGDQMSAYLLSLPESIKEVDEILSPIKNDMGTDGFPLMTPSQDMIMGLYLLTLQNKDYKDQEIIKSYPDLDAMISDYDLGNINLSDKVEVMMRPYNQSMFSNNYKTYSINKLMDKTNRANIELYDQEGNKSDRIKNTIYTPLVEVNNISNMMEVTSDGMIKLKLEDKVETDNIILPIVPQLEKESNIERVKVTSTVGRFIFNTMIPQDLGYIDRDKDKYSLEWDSPKNTGAVGRDLTQIITKTFRAYSTEVSCYVRDLFKEKGYHYATVSGVSLSLEDIKTARVRDEIVNETYDDIEILKLKYEGNELEEHTIKAWENATARIRVESMDELDDNNPVKIMANSGARGKDTQIMQMIGIRGIMMDANNNKIAVPILENFSEGLSPISYIISSYGSCKGIIDRSNKTAETGDLARHLIFGNSSVIITDGDCGDSTGTLIKPYPMPDASQVHPYELKGLMVREKLKDSTGELLANEFTYICEDIMNRIKLVPENLLPESVLASKVITLSQNIKGRTPVEDILDLTNPKHVLFHKGVAMIETLNNQYKFNLLDEQYSVTGINVRSIQTCKSASKGYCARCYGYLFPKHRHARLGDSVGTFAAHALSEPGTQMTMRTFHTGGVAEGDTSAGFDQLKKAIISANVGTLDKLDLNTRSLLLGEGELERSRRLTEELGDMIANQKSKKNNDLVKALMSLEYPKEVTHEHFGLVKINLWRHMFDTFYQYVRDPMLANNLDRILSINFEITARQATSTLSVVDPGDSILAPGQDIKIKELIRTNVALLSRGKKAILAVPTINGFKSIIPDSQDPTKTIMFQNATKQITESAMMGHEDDLTNPMTALSMGNVMPLGDNIMYYQDKLKPTEEVTEMSDIISGYVHSPTYELSSDEVIETAEPTATEIPTTTTTGLEIPKPSFGENIPTTPQLKVPTPSVQPTEETEDKDREIDIDSGIIKGF